MPLFEQFNNKVGYGLINSMLPTSNSDWWRGARYYERGVFQEAASDVFGYDAFRDIYRFGKGILSPEKDLENFIMGEANKWAKAGKPAMNQAYRRFMDPYTDALSTKRNIAGLGSSLKSWGSQLESTGLYGSQKGAAAIGGRVGGLLMTSAGRILGPALALASLTDVLESTKQGYAEGGIGGAIKAGVGTTGSWVLQQAAINLVMRNPYAAAAAGAVAATVGPTYLAYKAATAIADYGGEIRRYSPWQGSMMPFSTRTAFTMRQQSAMLMGETGLAPRGYLGNEAQRLHL